MIQACMKKNTFSRSNVAIIIMPLYRQQLTRIVKIYTTLLFCPPSFLQSITVRVRRLAMLRRWHKATSGPWEWESGHQKPVLQTRPRASRPPLRYLLLSRLNLELPLHTNQEIITISLMMIKISISDHVIFDWYTLTCGFSVKLYALDSFNA